MQMFQSDMIKLQILFIFLLIIIKIDFMYEKNKIYSGFYEIPKFAIKFFICFHEEL